MAVRIRKDHKTIVCAAKSEPEDGDIYIDDGLHYDLGVIMRVLSVYGLDENGADLWEFHARLPKFREFMTDEELEPYLFSTSPVEKVTHE